MINNKLEDCAIEIKSIEMATDTSSTFNSKSSMNLIGSDMSKLAARKAYEQAGIPFNKVADIVDVVELHDCFSTNELCMYEALGLC